ARSLPSITATMERAMNPILLHPERPAHRARPEGGWAAPLLVVIGVTLLASRVLSSGPEPYVGPPGPAAPPPGVMAAPPVSPPGPTAATPGAMASPPVAATAPVEDQAEFVEFGFDSQFGMVPPRGARAGAAGPENSRGAVRQGALSM